MLNLFWAGWYGTKEHDTKIKSRINTFFSYLWLSTNKLIYPKQLDLIEILVLWLNINEQFHTPKRKK